jgi:argininosuccinate lyase
MRFAPEYVRYVLDENFEDAKAFFVPLVAIHCAHLVMLTERGIVVPADARALRAALLALCPDQVRCATYDGTCEDLFFYIERLIREHAGEAVAGRLHTARSRNDIDMTMYRMRQRMMVLDLADATFALRDVLLAIAGSHLETIFPAQTHMQPAQPTTLAHYLMGVIEQIQRDAVRLRAAFATTNVCPLGACAITGTAFRIDRRRTSELLGFSAPTGNTYGSIATVDYTLENVTAAAVTVAGLGRVIHDLLLWCTEPFGFLTLADGFVQTSSIMPQKRNPVALEHARSISSRALGQAAAVMLSIHNTPFGDIVDIEDDLQPIVNTTFRDATRAVALVASALREATFDVAKMEHDAERAWITSTEAADTLTREHDIPFRQAHAIAAGLIEERRRDPDAPLGRLLADVSQAIAGRRITYAEEDLRHMLSARHFVSVRRTPGGPAPEVVDAAIDESRQMLEADRAWLTTTRDALLHATARLQEALDRL